jgi:hypothetical protein
VEQGIWGKVHGARSDFRWIAATRGFASIGRDLERELAVGIEDRPLRFPLWRAAAGIHLAGTCYPSRARDAAGRGGALEKHLLAWRTDRSIPAALAALLLLPRAAELDDGAWWGRAELSDWDADPRFVLDLGEGREIPVAEEIAERNLMEGIASLRTTLGEGAEAALAELFDGLLHNRRPFFLPVGETPLTPHALAVLLLPLNRERADHVSLAGWLPSSRPPSEGLGERWDLVAYRGAGRGHGRSSAADSRAFRMAAALLAGDPHLLASSSGPDRIPAPQISWGFEGTPRPEEDPPVAAPQRPGEGRPALRNPLDLPEPPAAAGRGWRLVYELARDPNRFWLDPGDLAPWLGGLPEGEDRGALKAALTWIGALASNRPAGSDGEQLRAKQDLLRAAVLALRPTADTLDALGPFRSGRVPPILYFTGLCPETRERARRALGEDRMIEMIRQSKAHCAPELRPRIVALLEHEP